MLTPSQEIKVFACGTLAFAFSDARWRLLDIPSKYAAWCKAVNAACTGGLALRVFQAALNLSEDRKGALFVVLRDPAMSIPQLIAPADRMIEEVATDDPEDPDNLSPRLAKRSLHHIARGQNLLDLDPSVIEALAGIDGAVVTDHEGRLLTFGAILRIDPEALKVARAVEARGLSPPWPPRITGRCSRSARMASSRCSWAAGESGRSERPSRAARLRRKGRAARTRHDFAQIVAMISSSVSREGRSASSGRRARGVSVIPCWVTKSGRSGAT